MSKEPISKIYLIVEKIEYIEQIIQNSGNITSAILMHLTSIAEQFNKLKHANETEILNAFEKEDIEGMYDVRTYIAHDYEGVNLAIVEWIIRHGLPKFKKQCVELIEKE